MTAPPLEQLPLRTCPRCGQEERTRRERCSHCGSSYDAAPRALRRRRWMQVGVAGVMVAALLTVGAVVLLGQQASRQKRENAAANAQVAALRGRLKRIQAPHRGAAPQLLPPAGAPEAVRLRARADLVHAVEQRITADARARAKAGELDGPIAQTACGPILKSKTAIPDDRVLSKHIGRYDCVAVKHPIIGIDGQKVGDLGHAFVAALDFDRFTYTWCRNTPAQGEAGKALVFVRLDRSCLAATGPAVGTGYVDVPGS